MKAGGKVNLLSRPRLARWKFILAELARGQTTVERLAVEWEVSSKTLQRDIETLRNLGVDIQGTMYVGTKLIGGCCPLCAAQLHSTGNRQLIHR